MAEATVPTVRDLRKKGYKVRIIHWRRIDETHLSDFDVPYEWYGPITFKSSKELRDLKLGYNLESKGGYTVVSIRTPEGGLLYGRADCSLKDTYCKRTGRELAIERALLNA